MAPTTPELKLSLKEIGMSQSGDKGTLEFRLARGNECIKLGLKTPDNDPVHQIKLGPLKKHAAKAGVSPIGSLDEVLFAYIEFLKKNGNNNNNSSSSSSSNTNSNDDNNRNSSNNYHEQKGY